jgi:hypothetical protein
MTNYAFNCIYNFCKFVIKVILITPYINVIFAELIRKSLSVKKL